MKGYIYKIMSPSGKIYVGMTIDLEKRKSKYKNLKCKGQPKIYNSLNKYSWDAHVFEVIETMDYDKKILIEREIYWIKFYDSYNIGLNCTKGGEGNNCIIISEETRKKLSIANTGKKHSDTTKEKIRIANTGKQHSQQTKDILAFKHKGKTHSQKTKDKMSQSQILKQSHSNIGTLETGLKLCSRCKLQQPFENFDENKKNKDGRRNPCKECRKQERQIPEVKAKHAEYSKKYYADGYNEYHKELYKKNKSSK